MGKRITTKQRRVAELIVENATLDKPLNKGEIVEKSRYAHNTVIKPSQVLESKGVKLALKEMGFDENNAKRVVGEILNEGSEQGKLKAADMVFKVESTYAPEKSQSVVVNVELNQNKEKIKQVASEVIKKLIEDENLEK